ncbi:hypothetical protein E2C01_008334 [Portunus trituberculatus]|uniref:Uncharacterized protein n=1 Tax=Portunus trituberculatus TaxID=210409 RepID=A0A5B7D232_PORTR|nr:hypothetical protein [Portunus trituberculatus]
MPMSKPDVPNRRSTSPRTSGHIATVPVSVCRKAAVPDSPVVRVESSHSSSSRQTTSYKCPHCDRTMPQGTRHSLLKQPNTQKEIQETTEAPN